MGLPGIRVSPEGERGTEEGLAWREITERLLSAPRTGRCTRNTRETRIDVAVNLDRAGTPRISTGIGFFDHMLEQIARHGGFDAVIEVKGDLDVDDHHTVEDTALALGTALRQALGDKDAHRRFGFLPPDGRRVRPRSRSISPAALIAASRARSTASSSAASPPRWSRTSSAAWPMGWAPTSTFASRDSNTHHRVESAFKAVGRSLRDAIARTGGPGIPSTKGTL